MIIPIFLNVDLNTYVMRIGCYDRLMSYTHWRSISYYSMIILQLQSKFLFDNYHDRFFNNESRFGIYSHYSKIDIDKLNIYKSIFIQNPKKYFEDFLIFQTNYLTDHLIIPCIFREEFDFLVSNYECLTICLTDINPKPNDYIFDFCFDNTRSMSITDFLRINFAN